MESVDGRTVAQPSAPTVYVKQDVVGAWIIIDIQLYVFPASRHGERGCPRNVPDLVCLLDCRLVGSLLFQVLAVEGVMACVDDA